jgi:hypothetical protein
MFIQIFFFILLAGVSHFFTGAGCSDPIVYNNQCEWLSTAYTYAWILAANHVQPGQSTNRTDHQSSWTGHLIALYKAVHRAREGLSIM